MKGPVYAWRQPRDIMLARFPAEFEACLALDDLALAHRPPVPDADGPAYLLLKTWVRSTKSYRGALLLAGQGFGPQAGMVARTLFEDMLIAHYAVKNPQVFERFAPARKLLLDRHREALEGFGRHEDVKDLPPRLTPGEREEARRLNPGNRWTGLTIRQLVDAVEDMWSEGWNRRLLRQMEKLSNVTNNALVHHSPVALGVGIEPKESGVGLNYMTGASEAHVREALGSAFYSYSNLLTITLDEDVQEEVEKVAATFLGLWTTIPDADARSSRDTP
jgi:hypothetical protein